MNIDACIIYMSLMSCRHEARVNRILLTSLLHSFIQRLIFGKAIHMLTKAGQYTTKALSLDASTYKPVDWLSVNFRLNISYCWCDFTYRNFCFTKWILFTKIRSIFIELRKLMEPQHAEINTKLCKRYSYIFRWNEDTARNIMKS